MIQSSSQSISRQMREMNRLQSRAISKRFSSMGNKFYFFLAKLYKDKPGDCIAYLVTSWGQSAWKTNQDRPKFHWEVEKHANNIYKDLDHVRFSVICIFQLRVMWFNNYPTLGRFKWIGFLSLSKNLIHYDNLPRTFFFLTVLCQSIIFKKIKLCASKTNIWWEVVKYLFNSSKRE